MIMVRLSKFELGGLAVSVVVMAIALYLLRIETSVLSSVEHSLQTASAVGTVVVDTASSDTEAAREQALYQAVNSKGMLEKMVIEDVKIGTGDVVAATGNTLVVHYSGRLQNGEEFDSSRSRGEPFSFTLGEGRVIPGWEQGLLGMKVGGERVLVIPPELGYGSRSVGPIPANATLVFVVELIEIK